MTETINDIIMCFDCVHKCKKLNTGKDMFDSEQRKLKAWYYCYKENHEIFGTNDYCPDFCGFKQGE